MKKVFLFLLCAVLCCTLFSCAGNRNSGGVTGVYQPKNGNRGYRFCVSVNGKSISKRCSRDAFGRILQTKKEAIHARMQAIVLNILSRQ